METPNMEPTSAQPTYHPCCQASNWNCSVTCPIVPEITAVSYPNNNPPIAATIDKKNIYPIFRSIFLIVFKLFILYQNTPYIDYTNDQPEDKQIGDS